MQLYGRTGNRLSWVRKQIIQLFRLHRKGFVVRLVGARDSLA
jgi:hypothetical protein